MLEAEGLLTVMPRSGIRIVLPDLELIKNAHQLRRLLEREAVPKFTISCPPMNFEAWAERHMQLAKAVENGLDQPDLAPRHAEVDGGFHHELIRALRNPIIEEVYDRTMERLLLIRPRAPGALTPLLVKMTMAEHLKIITAMKRGSRRRSGSDGRASDASLHRAMGV